MGAKWWQVWRQFSGKRAEHASNGYQTKAVDELLHDLFLDGKVPGLAVEAWHNGASWFSGGYGYANLQTQSPVIPETSVFRVASISKPITATALVRMVEAGTLDLDTDLRTYVPEFPERHGPVSLKQLAAHTAGIRAYKGKEFALNRPFSIADSLEVFVEDPLVYTPGKGYLYNSFDFVLLSLAMERAAGIPFDKLVEALVLTPLAMENTCMEEPGNPAVGQTVFYTKRADGFREAVPVDTRYKLAGGGYLSTVSDVCRMGQAYLDGRIAAQSVLQPFLTSQVVSGKPTYYGLGWQVSSDAAGRPFYGHIGNAVGAYSNFFVYPAQQLVICMLVNCSVPEIQPDLNTIVNAIHKSLQAGRDIRA